MHSHKLVSAHQQKVLARVKNPRQRELLRQMMDDSDNHLFQRAKADAEARSKREAERRGDTVRA